MTAYPIEVKARLAFESSEHFGTWLAETNSLSDSYRKNSGVLLNCSILSDDSKDNEKKITRLDVKEMSAEDQLKLISQIFKFHEHR
jgi:hypothetical protein